MSVSVKSPCQSHHLFQEGGLFQGQKLGSCLTLGNELSEEIHVLTKQEILLGKGTWVESSRVRKPRRPKYPLNAGWWEPWVGGKEGNPPAQNTPFTPLLKIRTRTCRSSRSWARASSSCRGDPIRYLPAQPQPTLVPALTHLTDEDVPQGIAGTWSVHQNLSNSCRGQGSVG